MLYYSLVLLDRHKNCKEQIATISRKIKTLFEGSLVELEMEIVNFDQRMSEMQRQCTETEEELSQLKKSSGIVKDRLATHDKKQVLAKQQHQSEQACKAQLLRRVKEFCRELQIPIEENSIGQPEKLEEVLQDIEAVIMSKHCEIAEIGDQNDKADQKRQAKIDELRIDLTKSEQSVAAQEKQREQSKRESETLEVDIQRIEASMHELKQLEKKIADANELYENTTKNYDQQAMRDVIAAKKSFIAEKQAEFKKLDEQLTFLGSMAKLVAEIGLKQKELEKKTQEVHRVRSRHSDNFGKFFKEKISGNYRRSMQGAYDKLNREIKDLNEKANAQKFKEQSYEIKRKNLIGDIGRMEKELKESEELIFQKCRSTPYDELLDRSKVAITKLQFDHGALKSAEALYKK